jgi:hypothetical protein
MSPSSILDTFADFLNYWDKVKTHEINVQIEKWKSSYMEKYPELCKKQITDYRNIGVEWRDVAKRYVFSRLPNYLEEMPKIHSRLLKCLDPIYATAMKKFKVDFNVIFVIYVGIGLGAGWATTYRNMPAVLFGLENIVDCGWFSKESLSALAAHEISHLIHFEWRKKQYLEIEYSSPYWPLYEEGFATWCEHFILGKEIWRYKSGQHNWVKWCLQHQKRLAQEFLRRVNRKEDIRPFFGSWFDLFGQKQTGYYLGHEIIKIWRKELDIEQIAVLSISEITERINRTITEWEQKI